MPLKPHSLPPLEFFRREQIQYRRIFCLSSWILELSVVACDPPKILGVAALWGPNEKLKTRPFFPISTCASLQPAIEAIEHRLLLSAGDLDPTFGSGGIVTLTPLTGLTLSVGGAAVQSDGKVLGVGRKCPGQRPFRGYFHPGLWRNYALAHRWLAGPFIRSRRQRTRSPPEILSLKSSSAPMEKLYWSAISSHSSIPTAHSTQLLPAERESNLT